MSLLMDALRRAEADESPESTTADAPVAKDTAAEVSAPPAPDSKTLQLEPMDSAGSSDGVLAEANDQNVANDTPAMADKTLAADDGKSGQADARRAAHSMARKRSPLKKQAIYIFTGFATAGFILAAYYLWQPDRMTTPQFPHSATLVTTPDTSVAEEIAETVDELVAQPAKQVVQATPDSQTNAAYQAPLAGSPVPPATATTHSAPVATTENPEYKIEIHKHRTPRAVPERLKQAYQAYQGKDYQQAEQLYRQALRSYPGNRDAMLGLAAIALHQGDRRVAHYYYAQILEADPADKTALLALQALKGKQYQLEHGSQIKHWLQSDRDSAPLHFALGNQHAANGRWKEAQHAYFEAYRLQSGNADFAFNLAVSLDQLGLETEALNYYLTARKLSGSSSMQFSSIQLDRRINQLRDQVEKGS